MEKNNLYALLALIVVVALIASTAIVLNNNTGNTDEGKTLVGKLVFPRDEGAHDEVLETWSVYMNAEGDDGSDYTVFMIWYKYWLNMEKVRSFSIYLEKDGHTVYSTTYKDFRQDVMANDTLDIEWVSSMGGVMHFKRENPGAGMHMGNYTLQFVNEENYFEIDVDSFAHRNVTLMGMDGYADMGMLGIIKGYIQPDLDVSGKLLFNGVTAKISGSAAYSHLWGYLPTDTVSFSSLLVKNEEHTVFFFRTYLDRTKPAWEFFYNIMDERYTVFVTHYGTEGNNTVGASVEDNYRMKDLTGESYDAYVLDYFLEPADPSSHRCYPDHWFLKSYYDNYSCICNPLDYLSDEKSVWEGFMTGKDSDNRSMWGFGQVWTYYISRMKIENVSLEKVDNNVEFAAIVESSLPLNMVVLNYSFNISGVWERHNAEMHQENGAWVVSLEIPEGATEIRAKVHTQDMSYRWESSDLYEYSL